MLRLEILHGCRLVAGEAGLDRPVLWSHVVDMPDPAPWVPSGYFLLTTGYSWPREERGQRELLEALAVRGVAGVGLAVPRYVEAFSAAEREVADRHFLPLVEIPFEIPFVRITEELHRAIAAEPYRVLERTDQIHHALMRAASSESTLDDLARTLGPLIGRSVTFEDPDGKLLASCSVDERTDTIRKETLEHAQTPPAMLEALESSGLDRRLRASEKPIRVPPMPRIGLAARLACPIRLGTEFVGVVWIIEGDEPLSELDHRAAEYAALVAAIHIAHQRELATVEARLGYASMLSLLESDDELTPSASERVRLLGFDAERSYRAAIAVLPAELPLGREGFLRRDQVAARVREALRKYACERLVSVALNRVPFLLPANVDVEAIAGVLDDDVCVVAGRAHRGAVGVRASYREALALLRYRSRTRVCAFDDVLVPRVIGGDPDARRTFVDDLLRPLLEQRGGKSLAAALIRFARHGFRMGETANALAIHANTLRYRLNRASEILCIRLDDADTRFELQLAAKLLELDGEHPDLSTVNNRSH
ncbi:MAG: PucR family transcriptional regulator ligand-binding domain-containing protein [Candidatus Eremiobacteraeota bacterium]|nr:PucR family transcriptional regulator ligand-binding domain-containing protein [Candidatus Eremiobacteraeota bacterium]MBV8722562.1 PucR family transcriptional regulator ligand-binding domain-containing protein [Candidatus Eremiobacteraeota bacterium]